MQTCTLIVTNRLYMLMLCRWSQPSSKVTGVWESKNQLSRKSFDWTEWNFLCCWDLLVQWSSFCFNLVWLMLRERTPLHDFIKKEGKKGEEERKRTLLNFNLCMWQTLLKCIFCDQFEWSWPSFKVTVVSESKNCCFQISQSILMNHFV